MAWDLCFIVSWGYLLARVASRAFAWLAGEQGATPRKPPWRLLGFAPLVAVGGDVAENLSVWFALALHWMGTDVLACVVLWFGALGSLAKLGGLVACLPLAAVRGWIAVKEGAARRSR